MTTQRPANDEPTPAAEGEAPADDEMDVEGHNFSQNAMLSRSAASNRERDVQQNLRERDLKKEARRPFLRKS